MKERNMLIAEQTSLSLIFGDIRGAGMSGNAIGTNESFNGKLRDELLNREIFTTLKEAKVLIEQWRREYNQVRPHSSLGYRPPAPGAILTPVMT
jgi:transposase InsO family protein